jgi:hypothetical protein
MSPATKCHLGKGCVTFWLHGCGALLENTDDPAYFIRRASVEIELNRSIIGV